jgi:hypothetical protein
MRAFYEGSQTMKIADYYAAYGTSPEHTKTYEYHDSSGYENDYEREMADYMRSQSVEIQPSGICKNAPRPITIKADRG